MGWPIVQWLKRQQEENEIASEVAQQMKLALDKSDLVDMIKDINKRAQINSDKMNELRKEQQVLVNDLEKVFNLLKVMP